jgi:enamine deaminase RidA (YjgF/YER057c/UK114 family)
MTQPIEARLEELGISLPDPPEVVANYVATKRTERLVAVSGLGPAGGIFREGKLGVDLSVTDGYAAARSTGLNILARLRAELGSLDRITEFFRLHVMINSAPDFREHSRVADGCSDLLTEVFGDRGLHVRTAVGMNSLPRNIPVEIETMVIID